MSIRSKRTAKLRVFPRTPGLKPRSCNLMLSKRMPANRWQDFVSGAVTGSGNSHTNDNGKAAGIDGITLEEDQVNLSGNLYKLWNRLTSGSYFPKHVREKKIDKKGGTGKRMFGIPTVNDRVAQQVVKMFLEPKVDHTFHADSYGYRRRRSAHDALEKAKQRIDIKAWKWVIDIDIERFFDTIDHNLMMKAVQNYTRDK